MTPARKEIISVGVGKMGLPMARHLSKAGHQVLAVDPDPTRRALAQAHGLQVSEELSIGGLTGTLLLSSLPDDQALLSMAQHLANLAPQRATLIDTSTVSVDVSAKVAQLLSKATIGYLRCSVSGNNHMAEAGQLTLMASGPLQLWNECESVLAAFAPVHFYLGPTEQARLMKLVVNLMIAQTASMLSEALALGQAGGLDWQQMWQVIGASAVASPIVKAKAVQLSKHDYTPTFTVPQMLKDVDLILQAADQLRVPLPHTALTRQAMLGAIAQGLGTEDYASIIKTALRSAGLSGQPTDPPRP